MLRFGWIEGESAVLHPAHWNCGLTGTPFQSHQWQSAWYKSFGRRNADLLGLKVFEGRDPIAYWTFLRSKGLCRQLTPLGVRGSDYLPPMTLPGSNPWPAITVALSNAPDVDLLNLRRLRQDQTPLPVQSESKCLVLKLPNSYEEYEKNLSKSLRADIRKGKNLKITETSDNIEILFRLHQARWRSRGWPGAFLRKSREFHEKVDENRSIYTVWDENTPIGAIYTLNSADVTYFYQSGFDPEYKRQSPGSLLIAHAIRTAIERGCKTFDFLRGDEPYKRRWKPTEELNCGTFLANVTARGKLGADLLLWANNLEAQARIRFEGRPLLTPKT